MDYLQWQSELTLEHVFSSGESFTYPTPFADGYIYLTELKSERSRSVLMYKSSQGVAECLTPSPLSLRTKISEYGGRPFWLLGNHLYFSNQEDQCLYRQKMGFHDSEITVGKTERITPKPTDDCVLMYTDIMMFSSTKLLAIVEKTNPSDASCENNTSICCIDLEQIEQAPSVVEQGADFYSNLVFDSESNMIAWVQWNHPSMPWDGTSAFTASVVERSGSVSLTQKTLIELDESASVCQLLFANNGYLFLSVDFVVKASDDDPIADFWNVYCYQTDNKNLTRVTQSLLEFGYPHWQYGDCRITQFDESTLLTVGSAPSGDHLFLIDQESLKVTPLLQTNSTIERLSSDGQGRSLMVELPCDTGARIIEYTGGQSCDVLVQSDSPLAKAGVSIAQHMSFDCRDGGQAHGFYYPPCNAKYSGSEENSPPPPLIVMVHGGPTARAYGHFDIQKQFWTSRGFALFDVNHRGSSGYGRRYRDALYQQWGEIDCSDIVDGINALVDSGKANYEQICIRGKSAGGYAVLRALTQYPDVFKAGACYYGIGNLATLAQSTHKFEQHYTDRLIGEPYDAETANQPTSRFYQRSPIHDVDKLQSSMIVFQGALDHVVPPEVAHEVIGVLAESGVDHEYVEYPDEAHGFRQVVNNIDAWGKELAFYKRVLAVKS